MRFISNFTRELCRILGIKQNISTAYHPQTDGQSEQTNQSLEQYLRIVCRKDQHAWAEWLPLVQYVHTQLMAIQYDEENPLQINPQIYPECPPT